jgi:hypothetical protein
VPSPAPAPTLDTAPAAAFATCVVTSIQSLDAFTTTLFCVQFTDTGAFVSWTAIIAPPAAALLIPVGAVPMFVAVLCAANAMNQPVPSDAALVVGARSR